MLGLNAQAWNTPGGIYDRFAGLMGTLATAPNERRKIELARQSHADELAERIREHDQDYELKKMYYESLMGKPVAGTAAANNLAWRQSVEQNPAPADDVQNDKYGAPVTNPSTGKLVMIPAGSANTIPSGEPAPMFGSAPVIQLPDIRQDVADEAKAKQMSSYMAATGHGWSAPEGVTDLAAQGKNPYATALNGGPSLAALEKTGGLGAGAASPYAGAVSPPATKVAQYTQFSGLTPKPESVGALFGADNAAREMELNKLPAIDRKAAALALMQLGYQ